MQGQLTNAQVTAIMKGWTRLDQTRSPTLYGSPRQGILSPSQMGMLLKILIFLHITVLAQHMLMWRFVFLLDGRVSRCPFLPEGK